MDASPQNKNDSTTMLTFVLANGLPICKDGQYRYHGVSDLVWHATQHDAINAAINDANADFKR